MRPNDLQRLTSRPTVEPSGCWRWPVVNPRGYGRVTWHGKGWQAHRLFYTLLVADIPAGLQIDHLCRNRACVNPTHMEAVTQRENILRGVSPVAKRAAMTHCAKGHPFDSENTRVTTGPRNQRRCLTCERARPKRKRVWAYRQGSRAKRYQPVAGGPRT